MQTVPSSIYVYNHGNGWCAAFVGPAARRVYNAFGTNVLPTPYTDAADPDAILRDITRLNPDCHVYLESGTSDDGHTYRCVTDRATGAIGTWQDAEAAAEGTVTV